MKKPTPTTGGGPPTGPIPDRSRHGLWVPNCVVVCAEEEDLTLLNLSDDTSTVLKGSEPNAGGSSQKGSPWRRSRRLSRRPTPHRESSSPPTSQRSLTSYAGTASCNGAIE